VQGQGASSPIRGVMHPSHSLRATEEPGIADNNLPVEESQGQQQQGQDLRSFSIATPTGGMPSPARSPTVPVLSLGHSIKPLTPGTDRVGPLEGWDAGPAGLLSTSVSFRESDAGGEQLAIPAGYSGYDMQRPSGSAGAGADKQPTTSGPPSHLTIQPPPPPLLPTAGPSTQSVRSPRHRKPTEVKSVSLRTDDQIYIVVSGTVVVTALLQPDDPVSAQAAVTSAKRAAVRTAGLAPAWADPLAPVTLMTVPTGGTFTAAQALDLAMLQPPGALQPCENPREAAAYLAAAGATPSSVPAIPGTWHIVARSLEPHDGHGHRPHGHAQHAPAAEVLCMSKPMFELTARGTGRLVSPAELSTHLLPHLSSWASPMWDTGCTPGATLEEVAKRLAPRARIEDYKRVRWGGHPV
jgi:hypothetical protein